jgi:hypothetical protein
MQEIESTDRSLLRCKSIGRILFIVILIIEYFYPNIRGNSKSFITAIIVLGGLWFLEFLLTSWHYQRILRLIAEESYGDDPKWGSLFIRIYRIRYQDALGRFFGIIMLIEPILWILIAIWGLYVSSGRP